VVLHRRPGRWPLYEWLRALPAHYARPIVALVREARTSRECNKCLRSALHAADQRNMPSARTADGQAPHQLRRCPRCSLRLHRDTNAAANMATCGWCILRCLQCALVRPPRLGGISYQLGAAAAVVAAVQPAPPDAAEDAALEAAEEAAGDELAVLGEAMEAEATVLLYEAGLQGGE
jgi:hypothetical protein